MKHVIYIVTLFVFCLNSCTEIEEKNEILALKEENILLKNKLDSINNILLNEKIEPFTVDVYYQNHKVGDSVVFLVGTLYDRPYLKENIHAGIFPSLEDLENAYRNDSLFQYQLSFDSTNYNLETASQFKFENLEKGDYYFGGFYSLYIKNKLSKLPFRYAFTVH